MQTAVLVRSSPEGSLFAAPFALLRRPLLPEWLGGRSRGTGGPRRESCSSSRRVSSTTRRNSSRLTPHISAAQSICWFSMLWESPSLSSVLQKASSSNNSESVHGVGRMRRTGEKGRTGSEDPAGHEREGVGDENSRRRTCLCCCSGVCAGESLLPRAFPFPAEKREGLSLTELLGTKEPSSAREP